ncbi:MAG TPA: GNAT family N-acetyltransferase [Amnibacterium sp.]|jgi:predicted GNAT family acetyltransferase|uniref:GNAT family N-acetyltransferase n=1 Tax=Amnibacterium sp. TaxID=1872496 RepID=UPI002F91C0DA
MPEITTVHDDVHSRYLASLDGEVIGEAVYRDTEDGRIFTHSEINPAFEHQGYGTQMVRAALDDTRSAGLKPIGQCSMVRNFLAEHPDYARR